MAVPVLLISSDPFLGAFVESLAAGRVRVARLDPSRRPAAWPGEPAATVVLDVPAGQRVALHAWVRRHHPGPLVVLLKPGERAPGEASDPASVVVARPFHLSDLVSVLEHPTTQPRGPAPAPPSPPPPGPAGRDGRGPDRAGQGRAPAGPRRSARPRGRPGKALGSRPGRGGRRPGRPLLATLEALPAALGASQPCSYLLVLTARPGRDLPAAVPWPPARSSSTAAGPPPAPAAAGAGRHLRAYAADPGLDRLLARHRLDGGRR